MKIYTIIDRTPFVWWTTGLATMNLGTYINADVVPIYKEDLNDSLAIYEDADLLIFEIGNVQHAGWTAERLKRNFPNAKLVAFCSDTIYYQINGLQPQLEPGLIDLHLEIMPQSIDWLKERGAKLVERWSWTTSDWICEQAKEYLEKEPQPTKQYDFIGVYHPGTISNPECWRHHAVKHIQNAGYSFTQGGGTGHEDGDLNRLFAHYRQSWCTLGTSSHNRPELTRLGCCKGFRDVLGPLLGCPLVYDDHPNILSSFTCILPTYKYDNLESIISVYNELRNNEQLFERVLTDQIEWTYANTIEKQLVRTLLTNSFIGKEHLR
jgi:hypothetical protein